MVSLIWILIFQLSLTISYSYHEADFDDWYQPVARRPVDVVTDVVNDLGVRILQQYCDPGNVAFSPIGVSFVLAALYEGSAGRGSHQIGEALALPHDRDITRIGFRDVHRRLRTYLNADGFLGGLTLNRENTRLRPEYEDILRFYGFDLSDNDDGQKFDDTTTTRSTDVPTTESVGSTDLPDNQPTTEEPVTSTGSTMTETFGTTMAEGMVSDRLTQTSNITSTVPTVSPTSDLPATTSDGNLAESSTVSMEVPTVITPTPETMTTTTGQAAEATTSAPDTTMTPNATSDTTNLNVDDTMIPGSTLTVGNTMTTTSLNMQEGSTDSSGQTEATTLVMDASSIETNVTSVTENARSDPEVGPPAVESTVLTDQPITSEPSTMTPIENLESTTLMNEEGQGSTTATPPVNDASTNRVRKRSTRNSRGYFSSYPDQGIWMQDLGIWKAYPVVTGEASVRDSTEISFLVNGCDVSSVMATRYVAVLPFAYFPSLHAVAVEFPLDDPRYNILLLMPTDRTDTNRLARDLGGKSLRWLRKQLQPTWVRATIPSFMLRGFVTLTSCLQRLGITDVFEPRMADLSPMTPDLGVYVRDVQQSIGVNIRNYMKPDRTHSRNGLFERAGPVPFTVVHPFLYFIVDTETSVTLIAGRVDDPLNSRIV